MDVHKNFTTGLLDLPRSSFFSSCLGAHKDVVPRFNERFLLSLVNVNQSLVVDDELNILPLSLASRKIVPLPPKKVLFRLICIQLKLFRRDHLRKTRKS